MSNIGILDPTGMHPNPITGNEYSENYKLLAKKWSQLPAYKRVHEIINIINNNNIILLL